MIDVDQWIANVIDLDTFILEILVVGDVKSEPGGGGEGVGCGGCSAGSAAAGSVVKEEPGMEEPDRFGVWEEGGEDDAGSYHIGASAPNEVVSVGGEREEHTGVLHGGGLDPGRRVVGAVAAPGATAAAAALQVECAGPEPAHRRRSDRTSIPFSDRLDTGMSSKRALVDKRKRAVVLSNISSEKVLLTKRRELSPEPAPERAGSKKSKNGNSKGKMNQPVHHALHQDVHAVCPRVSTGSSEEGGSNRGVWGEGSSNSSQSGAAVHAEEAETTGKFSKLSSLNILYHKAVRLTSEKFYQSNSLPRTRSQQLLQQRSVWHTGWWGRHLQIQQSWLNNL